MRHSMFCGLDPKTLPGSSIASFYFQYKISLVSWKNGSTNCKSSTSTIPSTNRISSLNMPGRRLCWGAQKRLETTPH